MRTDRTDAHATGEGYLRSPRDGSLRDIVATTLELERSAGITVTRRLGVSLAARLMAVELGDTAEWGGEWVETEPSGPQGWWPAAECDDRLIAGLAGLGMRWLCVGATAAEHASRLIGLALAHGIGVALRPSAHALDAIDAGAADGAASAPGVTWESLPLLLHALVARTRRSGDGRVAVSVSDALRGLGRAEESDLADALRWILDTGIPVVPLITAAERQASLRSVVRAPHLAEASRVLPYHERIAALRAPGAMRMGGKEAALHLGVPTLDREGERETSAGLRRCREALMGLLEAGHDVRAGSGAPGVGLAPGLALLDEEALLTRPGRMEVAHG